MPVFPFLVLAGAGWLGELWGGNSPRKSAGARLFAIFCLGTNMFLSSRIDYTHSRPDTRTLAKQWIKSNILPESKILVSSYAYSPHLLRTREQLERLYEKAAQSHHYKKEYLRLQFQAHPGSGHGFEIYELDVDPRLAGTILHWAKEAQRVRERISVERGWEELVKKKIRYVITNSWDELNARRNLQTHLIRFYEELPQRTVLLKEFVPGRWNIGPTVRVYRLNSK